MNYPVDMAVADRPQARGGFADLRPSDHDLITLVLRPMVARRRQQQPFDGGGGGEFVHLADVYYVAPERLAERYAPAPGGTCCWYFICPARCRHRAAAGALGEGRWSAEAGDGEVVVSPVRGADGRRVGHSRTLSYSYGGARTTTPATTTVTRHGWCMVELALDDEHDGSGGVAGGGDLVLCKLFRSPHNEASPTAVAAAARTTAVPSLLFDCKRKAAGEHPEAPSSARQQLVVQHSF